MKQTPQFSIIVPIYNVQSFLPKCIESILTQTFSDFELILVDDGSSDSSGDICDRYAKDDFRIIVIHKENGGLVSARNKGLNIAKGRYITFVDGDDWVSEYWLESVQKIIEQYNPDIITYNSYKVSGEKKKLLDTSQFKGFYTNGDIKSNILPNVLYDKQKKFYTFGILPAIWAKVIKSKLLKENICKEEKITFGEDAVYSYQCLLHCNSLYGLNKPLYYYRQNNQSMTKAYDSKRFDRIDILFDYFEKEILPIGNILLKQYNAYKIFCIFYAILNEGKSNKSIGKIALDYKEKLNKYISFIDNFDYKVLDGSWRLIYWLIIKHHYSIIAIICWIIARVKYSYKE